ncbi:helix-turn-helix domain-containing protein [Aeromonas salmonicida]|nr:helix-turn-helix domain-containing protein [Aeromonas salmonicida]
MNQSKIAKLRKDKSLTQENLAEKACVTVRTIQRIEAGEEVSSETLKNISNVLDVTINELFESIASSDKEEEIMEIAKEQQKQFHYRRNEQLTFRFIAFGVIFVFLGLFGIFVVGLNGLKQDIYGVVWIFMLFLSLAMMHYVLNVLISKKLDEKCQMTVGMNHKRSNIKQEPIKNGWEFMARYWWIIFPIGGFLSWLIPELTGK